MLTKNEWDGVWARTIKIWHGESSNFLRNCGSYFVQETMREDVLRSEKQEILWYGDPVGFIEQDSLSQMDESQKRTYYKNYYELLKTRIQSQRDYDAVQNHSYLMHYGGVLKSKELYRCDFSSFPMSIVQYFLLQLSQVKFGLPVPEVKEEKYEPKVVLSEMGQFRAKVVAKIEETESKKSQVYLEKDNTMTYYRDETVKMYFDRTAMGRLNDAASLMTNLVETQLIIPGDGYGIFTKVGQLSGKEIISGEVSRKMVNLANDLGVKLECEEGIKTIERGIEKFGTACLIFVSFLWTIAPKILDYVSQKHYRVLVYDKYLYYKGSSEHVEYGSRLLRGTRGTEWRGVPIKMSEETEYHVDKPMLTEITKGVLWFDSVKALRQIALYSEMYPWKIKVASTSKIKPVDLKEMSLIHKFLVVNDKPKIWLVRCPHNAGNGLTYDVDLWKVVPDPVDVNKMIIGSIDTQHVQSLFLRKLVSKGTGNRKRKIKKKHVSEPRINLSETISLQNTNFKKMSKYYLKSSAKLTPSVRPIFDDGVVQMVWLRGGTYVYEEGDSQTKYVNFVLTS